MDTVSMDGIVVIGEGEKDNAPMLYNGESVGSGDGPAVDVAVDPLEGTRLTAKGQPNAISVIGVAERGTMFNPGPFVYMEKIAAGEEAADAIDIEAPIAENIRRVAKAKDKKPEEVGVTILDRPRHEGMIAEIREIGARVHLITDGDVAGAIVAAAPRTEIDLLLGIGGTPEGVVAAAALKSLGGAIQGRGRRQSGGRWRRARLGSRRTSARPPVSSPAASAGSAGSIAPSPRAAERAASASPFGIGRVDARLHRRG